MTRAPIRALVISLRNWWRFTPTYWSGFRPILTLLDLVTEDEADFRALIPLPLREVTDPRHMKYLDPVLEILAQIKD